MRINKLYIVIGLMVAFGLFFELAAHADETNQETTITFSAPVQIPGQVLRAGEYVFLADPDNQNLIRVFNADRTVLYATLETASAERTDARGDTVFTLAAPESGKPDFLVKWFYPGRLIGHEFVYPKRQEQEIAHAAQETVVANQPTPAGYAGSN
jgi:hypothetical protein